VTLSGFVHILDTDYYNYAVVLGCGSVGKRSVGTANTYAHMIWIFSRTTRLDAHFMARINETLRQNNMSLVLRTTNQNNCNGGPVGGAVTVTTTTEAEETTTTTEGEPVENIK
jgi:hypothetical protein